MARTTSSSINIEVKMVHNEMDNRIEELEKLSGDLVVDEAVRMLKKVQSRDWEKVAHLQIMVAESSGGTRKFNFHYLRYQGLLLGIKELLQDNAAEGLNTASYS
ncbi:hypothetical protein Tco_0475661 [Tanacetum coccineum]